MQWFKVPSKIYFERDSIQYLQSMGGMERVVIVTDRTMLDLGFVEKIAHQITARGNHVTKRHVSARICLHSLAVLFA